MKSCICTVIKNEHQYLDEWIQYHLRLGIDYIFIFEDFDSDSHKNITDKYDNVSLCNIHEILTDSEKNKAFDIKINKRYNVLHFYYKHILLYIKSKYQYDWCFILDADEFITLENNEQNINYALSKYENYDAIILRWKCYGASGHISSVVCDDLTNIYTEESNGLKQPLRYYNKVCFNLKNYQESFFESHHYPSDICNWVNTNFEKIKTKEEYKNLFIRHYITKSWRDYVYKIKDRGFTWGKDRKYETFFDVNPELNCVKKELMQVLEDETLVVLPYKQNGSQGSELELALSLWRKNCTFNYHFVVIGEYDKSFEEKFPWVEFIECSTKPKINGQYNPHLDILNKFVTVINKYKDKYKGFVAMCDDEYAIKPFTLFDILQTHYHSQSFTGDSKAPVNYWNHNKWKTRQLLDKENLLHINYTTHFPCWFDFEKLLAIIEKFDLMNESYVLEDIYFNYYEHEKPIKDDEIRLGIWNQDIYKRDFQRTIENPNTKFMCNSVEGWSKDLENDLRKLI